MTSSARRQSPPATPAKRSSLGNDVRIEIGDAYVATVVMHRGAETYLDEALIRRLADVLVDLDSEPSCRAVVLTSAGRHFCAGAKLDRIVDDPPVARGAAASPQALALYDQAVRLFTSGKPIVAAVNGAAIGGGLGLALAADFRVASPESRFSANFAQLGFFPGFGTTVTLPAVVGTQRAVELLYTGRRVGGDEAFRIGLCDRLVARNDVLTAAHAMAAEIAMSAPLSTAAIRRCVRGHLIDAVRAATRREAHEQGRLASTADFEEGVAAMRERRPARFVGR